MPSPAVVWFREIGKDDVPLAGGKGANLGELTRAGIAVPPGFVVTAPCYRQFLDETGARGRLVELLSRLDHRDSAALQEASRAATELVASADVPAATTEAVRAAYEQLGGGPVAVRSSATAEDLPQASFAGQQSTFLNVVGGDRVVEAARACWASLFEPQAVFYRAEAGFAHMDVAIAVAVQRMVQAERSGVMFTVNPVSGDVGQLVIEAVFGLGEAAVSGRVTPDMYIVEKGSLTVVDRAVSEQAEELVYDAAAGGKEANVWRPVGPDRRGIQKLEDEQVAALARLGLRVEQRYGCPQDIEWAVEDDTIWLLQARPVTTLSR